MKLLHLADLHLGKRVNGFSMIEDQKHIITCILQIITEEKPDAVLIAGDVYDRTVPSEEAVELLDNFLYMLAQQHLQVYIISGNHDSADRLAYGGRLMSAGGIHISPVFGGKISPIYQTDEHGTVAFWPIPFVKPAHVRSAFPEAEKLADTFEAAMALLLSQLDLNPEHRNVALVHQFIAGAGTCDSEEQSVGGIDQISAALFDDFDYVALGHLHGPQHIHRPEVRYAGSPLKYSISEADQKKSVTIVELGTKGDTVIRTIPLSPLHDLVRLRGTFSELTAMGCGNDDYCEITLLDEDDIPEALSRLRNFYPYVMALRYDNARTRAQGLTSDLAAIEEKTDLELFEELYRLQNGKDISEAQRTYLRRLIDEIREGN